MGTKVEHQNFKFGEADEDYLLPFHFLDEIRGEGETMKLYSRQPEELEQESEESDGVSNLRLEDFEWKMSERELSRLKIGKDEFNGMTYDLKEIPRESLSLRLPETPKFTETFEKVLRNVTEDDKTYEDTKKEIQSERNDNVDKEAEKVSDDQLFKEDIVSSDPVYKVVSPIDMEAFEPIELPTTNFEAQVESLESKDDKQSTIVQSGPSSSGSSPGCPISVESLQSVRSSLKHLSLDSGLKNNASGEDGVKDTAVGFSQNDELKILLKQKRNNLRKTNYELK